MTNFENEKTIIVAGAHGFVGARIMQKYPNAIPLPSGLVRSPNEALKAFVFDYSPDLIINAAAISDIGACERDPIASYLANVKLPTALAEIANETNAKFISFSSDQVYTGQKTDGPYREEEELLPPANVYAQHKLEAEKRVLELSPNAVLLRATWMYDMPLYGHKNRGNFLINVLKSILQEEKMQFPDATHRGITYVRQAVEFLDKVAALPGGVYNYGSENPLTTYQTAGALFDALGVENLKEKLIEKLPLNDGKPHDLWLDGTKLKKHGIVFDLTAEGFQRCIKDYSLRLN